MFDLTPKPNLGGKIVRFIFGVILGCIMSICLLGEMFFDNYFIAALIAIVMSLLFGVISLKIGDKLWESVKDWIP